MTEYILEIHFESDSLSKDQEKFIVEDTMQAFVQLIDEELIQPEITNTMRVVLETR